MSIWARLGFALSALVLLALGAWRQTLRPPLLPPAFVVPDQLPSTASAVISAINSAPLAGRAFSEAAFLPSVRPIKLREIARYDIPVSADTPAAHASFLLVDHLHQGAPRLRVFWFGGSRESGPDVQIWMSEWQGHGWGAPVVVVNRHQVTQQLGVSSWIRRLGNPVAWVDGQGRTHLYVVATGLGGWAASRILHLVQQTANATFQPVGFLPLSPFFNLSTLVRGAPVALQDGGALLPAYFELGVKYPLAVRLNRDGQLVQTRHAVVSMPSGLTSLQPSLGILSDQTAVAYLRDGSSQQQLRMAYTANAGQSWQKIPSQRPHVDALINPDASPIAVRVAEHTLLIHNPQTTGRHRLVIDGSRDGLRHWQSLAVLENAPPNLPGVRFNEASYPSAVVLNNTLHVSYTYQKRLIRHVVFAIEHADHL